VTCSRDRGDAAERIGIVRFDIVHGALRTSRRRLMNVRSSTLDASPNVHQIGLDNTIDQFAETCPGVSLGYEIRRHLDDCGGVGDSHATASEFEQCRVVFAIADRNDLPAGIPSSSRATARPVALLTPAGSTMIVLLFATIPTSRSRWQHGEAGRAWRIRA